MVGVFHHPCRKCDWRGDFFPSQPPRPTLAQAPLARKSDLYVLEPAVAREGWKLILLSQLHPLFPTSLLNYLYGLTTIRFRTCMLWVAIGQAPGLFLYAYVGTLGQLGLNLLRGKSHPHTIEFCLWIGGLVIAVISLFCLGRIALRVVREVEEGRQRTTYKSGEQDEEYERELVNQRA